MAAMIAENMCKPHLAIAQDSKSRVLVSQSGTIRDILDELIGKGQEFPRARELAWTHQRRIIAA
ncbi:MAG: hypothetical protein WB763_05925 [Terriglobia bacterium]